jgi:hypothetical protein
MYIIVNVFEGKAYYYKEMSRVHKVPYWEGNFSDKVLKFKSENSANICIDKLGKGNFKVVKLTKGFKRFKMFCLTIDNDITGKWYFGGNDGKSIRWVIRKEKAELFDTYGLAENKLYELRDNFDVKNLELRVIEI